MFKQIFIDKGKKTIIFLIVYTLLFSLFFSTLSYTLPFVLAFAISIFTKPLNQSLRKKLKTSSGISSILSTLIVFAVLLIILTLILFKVVKEVKLLLISLPDMNTIIAYVDNLMNYLDKYISVLDFSKFDFNLIEKFYSQISTVVSSTVNVTKFIMNKMLSFVVGLPMLLMMAFITFLATYFFSKDMPNIETKILSVFSSNGRFKVRHILKETKRMLAGYFKSYACIMSLTFIESLLGLTILGIDYAMILSFLAAIVDLLPVLGVGSVFMPMALYFYLSGNSFVAIGLVIMFLLITVIRQVVEPKLMSTNLGIHPVFILGSIFIGLKAYGFLGVIYLLGLVIFYKIFSKVEIL